MKHWYYADETRQPQGPVDAATLRDLLAGGQISHATLIWRDGLAQWQAAADFSEELELGVAAPSASLSTESPEGSASTPPESSDVPASPLPWQGTGTDATEAASAQDASPYAAPQAIIEAAPHVVQGGEVVYAGFLKRMAAYILDSFLLAIINTVVSTVAGIAMLPLVMSGGMTDPSLIFVLQGVSYLVQILVMAGYFAWFYASPHQATPGKMAIGIKVVDGHGARISFWRGIGRFFATFISTLLLLAGYLMAAFTQRKQALHDLICGTLVVDKWAYTHHPERQRRELGTITWVILVLGGLLALLGLLAMGALIAALGGGFGR